MMDVRVRVEIDGVPYGIAVVLTGKRAAEEMGKLVSETIQHHYSPAMADSILPKIKNEEK